MGRSFAELDVLFERGVSARKFSKTHVDVFEADVDDRVMNMYSEQVGAAQASQLKGQP